MATITVDCAYEAIMHSSGISKRELRDPIEFRKYVTAVHRPKERWGHMAITIDAFMRLQRNLDPNKEANGRRSEQLWPGPKVQQGYHRLDKRPRWDRREAMTTGWEISKNLVEYVNFHPYKETIPTKIPSRQPLQSPLTLLKGKDQYWNFLMN